MESYLKQLEGLGLSDKEAKVYLASLELGSATAQQIAAKAAVVRPTAYVAIGGLVKRGLVSSFTKGKKQYITAEKPDQLMRLVQDEKKKIAEQEEKLKAILPGLSSLISLTGEKPEVKFYEGLEGLEAMRKTLFDSKTKMLYVIGSGSNYKDSREQEAHQLHIFRLERAGIYLKQIFINLSDERLAQINAYTSLHGKKRVAEYRGIKIPNLSDCEIAIFSGYVSIVSYGTSTAGYLIKNKSASTIAKTMFEALWANAKAPRLRI